MHTIFQEEYSGSYSKQLHTGGMFLQPADAK